MATKQQLVTLDMDGILSIVGDTRTVRILFELADGSKRFGEFSLDVSTKTLSARLKLLEDDGIVTRTAYAEVPPRVEYTLTRKGTELVSIIEGLLNWEQGWLQPELESSQRI